MVCRNQGLRPLIAILETATIWAVAASSHDAMYSSGDYLVSAVGGFQSIREIGTQRKEDYPPFPSRRTDNEITVHVI